MDMREPRHDREPLHDALVRLEDALGPAEVGDERSLERVRDAVDRLGEALDRHVGDTEAPDGLLAHLLDEEPVYAPRVDGLRREHRELLEDWEVLRRRAGAASAEELCAQASRLAARVDAHRHRSTELLLDAYQVDLPAVD